MDMRLLQALRLLMDVTLSEFTAVGTAPAQADGTEMSVPTGGLSAEESLGVNPQFDVRKFEELRLKPAVPPDFSVPPRRVEAETSDIVVSPPEGNAGADAPVPAVRAVRRAADVSPAPDSVVSSGDVTGGAAARDDSSAVFERGAAENGVRGTLSLRDISDHFEQDARRY